MRLWLAFLLLFISNLTSFQPQTSATSAITFSDLAEEYRFGEQIDFSVKISAPEPIKQLFLFVKPDGDSTYTETIPVPADGAVSYVFDLVQRPLRPFSNITYWYRVETQSTTQSQSEKSSFYYEDNRFKWQSLEGGNFHVHWITGDVVFGQAILNAAETGSVYANSILPAQIPDPVNIYVYNKSSDLQSALSLSQVSWVAGHASPDLGTILVSIAPGPDQQVELERQVPHELMHILVYQHAGIEYQHIPVWLNEGLASIAELAPNPDYESALTQAVQTETLMPFSTLCNAFPNEAYGAFLAYSESTSFVRFILQKYGASSFPKLISGYKNGLDCEEGVYAALGISLGQLEVRWQQESLHMDAQSLAFQNLAPYIAAGLLVVLLPLVFGLALRKKTRVPSLPAEEKHVT